MTIIPDWLGQRTWHNRLHSTSKHDLIHMIRKFLRDEDGSVPSAKRLSKMSAKQLAIVWHKYIPTNFYNAEDVA